MRWTLWLLLSITSFVYAAEELPWTRLDIPGVVLRGDGRMHVGLCFKGDFGWWNTGGQLWVTHDAGRSWMLSPSLPQNHTFYDSYFVDTLRGWIASAGETTELLHTQDGGITWQPLAMKLTQTSNPPINPRDVFLTRLYFKDAQNGLGIFTIAGVPPFYSTESILARTEDGGLQWTEIGRDSPFPQLFGFGEEVWIGNRYTLDFGKTFQLIPKPDPDFDLSFVSPLVGWTINAFVVGEGDAVQHRREVLKTIDGGHTWSAIFSKETSGIAYLCILSEDIGGFLWYLKDSTPLLYMTYDGGLSWIPYHAPLKDMKSTVLLPYGVGCNQQVKEVWLVPSGWGQETTLFYTSIVPTTAVQPSNKLPSTWGTIKRTRKDQ